MFDQILRGNQGNYPTELAQSLSKSPRTFKESIGDQIAFHRRKVEELQAVFDSLTPDIEKFVEAMQKLS